MMGGGICSVKMQLLSEVLSTRGWLSLWMEIHGHGEPIALLKLAIDLVI